jgi:hypothetical protein
MNEEEDAVKPLEKRSPSGSVKMPATLIWLHSVGEVVPPEVIEHVKLLNVLSPTTTVRPVVVIGSAAAVPTASKALARRCLQKV